MYQYQHGVEQLTERPYEEGDNGETPTQHSNRKCLKKCLLILGITAFSLSLAVIISQIPRNEPRPRLSSSQENVTNSGNVTSERTCDSAKILDKAQVKFGVDDYVRLINSYNNCSAIGRPENNPQQPKYLISKERITSLPMELQTLRISLKAKLYDALLANNQIQKSSRNGAGSASWWAICLPKKKLEKRNSTLLRATLRVIITPASMGNVFSNGQKLRLYLPPTIPGKVPTILAGRYMNIGGKESTDGNILQFDITCATLALIQGPRRNRKILIACEGCRIGGLIKSDEKPILKVIMSVRGA